MFPASIPLPPSFLSLSPPPSFVPSPFFGFFSLESTIFFSRRSVNRDYAKREKREKIELDGLSFGFMLYVPPWFMMLFATGVGEGINGFWVIIVEMSWKECKNIWDVCNEKNG